MNKPHYKMTMQDLLDLGISQVWIDSAFCISIRMQMKARQQHRQAMIDLMEARMKNTKQLETS